MNRDLHAFRQTYAKGELLIEDMSTHPMQQFTTWFKEIEEDGGVKEPNAMTLATFGEDGFPKSRIVLLKEYDQEGFVFYTNYESEKGKSIAKHPQVGISFFWPSMERQIIIKGTVKKVSTERSDRYFNARPKDSQLGALVSDQSSVIKGREVLEKKMVALKAKYESQEISRPPHWGGYLIQPVSIEFWQGRPSRLHDRIRYRMENSVWIKERLAP
ncbi:pyridoxamine 5'-phosphate oxidase [uncultured Dokdonia sp.]|uniref:pyridoxamine 5'-phosphate oxidase n=1 Tax=uncultured Dokdonia sp. TaxID=575653 RepID=UPI002626252E|nr:pyridoxamine 5'-phosphate oxidase [uncultured Dokdonia sp.]